MNNILLILTYGVLQNINKQMLIIIDNYFKILTIYLCNPENHNQKIRFDIIIVGIKLLFKDYINKVFILSIWKHKTCQKITNY
jgi:hypothetical protein